MVKITLICGIYQVLCMLLDRILRWRQITDKLSRPTMLKYPFISGTIEYGVPSSINQT
jgi:hypothetical protein